MALAKISLSTFVFIAIMILHFGAAASAYCPSADLTEDCYVGLEDLAVLADRWATGDWDLAFFGVLAGQWMVGEQIPPSPEDILLVDIPGGSFEMGDHFGMGFSRERPIHLVRLDAFSMSAFETTNAQYAAFLNAAMNAGLIKVAEGVVYAWGDKSLSEPYLQTADANGESQIEHSDGSFDAVFREDHDMGDHPVLLVSWYGAKAFCDFYGFRLPTEAEWEYAARAGCAYAKYPWCSNLFHCDSANGTDCNPLGLSRLPYTAPVGTYVGNGFGLHDMAGNVWEWCSDWSDYPEFDYYALSPVDNPTGPNDGVSRIIRGGGWLYGDSQSCRVARRGHHPPQNRKNFIGFRVAQDGL